MFMALRQRLAREADHQPGRDNHRDKEAEHHRRAGIDRDRRHVWPHQPRDEQHRQQRGHHCQRGDNGRVAHFGHGLDGSLLARSSIVHTPVPGNILDHHNGIIDQNADGKDQREQADPVDRKAHDPRSEHRQHDRGRNDNRGHTRLAPTDGKADKNDDGDRRQR